MLSGIVCNRLDGVYTIDFITGNINIHIAPMTLIYCDKEKEELYVEILNTVQSLSIQGNELRLYYNNNKNYLLFKKQLS